jgi:hypothetical protein
MSEFAFRYRRPPTAEITVASRYTWKGDSYSWFTSLEKEGTIIKGVVRCILGKLFHVAELHMHKCSFRGPDILAAHWLPVNEGENTPQTRKHFLTTVVCKDAVSEKEDSK